MTHVLREPIVWFETKCSAICGGEAQESVFIEIKHEIILTAI